MSAEPFTVEFRQEGDEQGRLHDAWSVCQGAESIEDNVSRVEAYRLCAVLNSNPPDDKESR